MPGKDRPLPEPRTFSRKPAAQREDRAVQFVLCPDLRTQVPPPLGLSFGHSNPIGPVGKPSARKRRKG